MVFNLPRALTQVVFVGSRIVFRAFMEAYQAAAAESAKNSAGAVAAGASKAGDMISQRTGMTLDEASKILDIPPNAPLEDIVKKYETLYNANDETQGGSFYLQSKIVRARERLELELQEKADQLKKEESSASQ